MTTTEAKLYLATALAIAWALAFAALRRPSAPPPGAAASAPEVWLSELPAAQRPAIAPPAGWRVAAPRPAAAPAAWRVRTRSS